MTVLFDPMAPGRCHIVLAFACGATAFAQERRAYAPPDLSTVRAITAEHGMVVAQERIAAQVGADILRQGGNAVDAAVATGFALAVTYPRAGNIGGGGFMVIHSAGRNEDVAIDYRETATGRDHAGYFSRTRRQTRHRQVAQFGAWHRRARNGSRAWRWRWRSTAPAVSHSRKS